MPVRYQLCIVQQMASSASIGNTPLADAALRYSSLRVDNAPRRAVQVDDVSLTPRDAIDAHHTTGTSTTTTTAAPAPDADLGAWFDALAQAESSQHDAN